MLNKNYSFSYSYPNLNVEVLVDEAETSDVFRWQIWWHPRPSQVTHDAPFGIFDMTGGGHWGSSQELLGAIYRTKPKAWECVDVLGPE